MALKAPTLPQALQDKGCTVADETIKVKVSGGRANHDIEIGDAKEPTQYIPQSKHLFFDNEGNVSFRPKLFNPSVGSVVVEDGVIKYITDEWEHHMYENEGEVFGFEHDFVLKQKPADLTQDYQVVYTTRTKGLKFYKQLPLTQAEIDEGCERPENVINSYAVYMDGKHGNHMYEGGKTYATGKVGHLYRVKAIDANGNWTWCDQEFDEQKQEYIQTVPKEFLETAAYPVRVDPQLGYITAGASSTGGGAGYIRSTKITTTATSYPSVISVYNTDTEPDNIKPIIFDVSGKNLVTNGVGNGAAGLTSPGWTHTYFSTLPTLATSTDYYVGVIMDASVTLYYDSGSSGDDWYDTSNSYASPTDPTDGGTDSRLYSIFATYSTSADIYLFYPYFAGWLLVNDAGASWSSIRDRASADSDANVTDPSLRVATQGYTTSNTWRRMYRSALYFDTSSLSSYTTGDISSAKLVGSVVTEYGDGGATGDGDIHICSISPASSTALVAGDYDAFGTTSWGELAYGDRTADATSNDEIVMNTTGISNISVSGNTLLGFRTEGDLENNATWYNGYFGAFLLRIYVATSFTSDFIYLEVDTSSGGGGGSTFTPRVMFY